MLAIAAKYLNPPLPLDAVIRTVALAQAAASWLASPSAAPAKVSGQNTFGRPGAELARVCSYAQLTGCKKVELVRGA
jgi:hypothetical protein